MNKPFIVTSAESSGAEESVVQNKSSLVISSEGTSFNFTVPGEIVETSSSDVSIENILNDQRIRHFRSTFSKKLIQLIREQDFEYGIDTPADELVRHAFHQNIEITKQWLNEIFIENYDNEVILLGILRVLSHFEYADITPQGPTVALAALANSNPEVREGGIRAFENWGNLESLNILENVQCDEEWLNEYLQQVVYDLREELDINASVG